MIMRSRLLALPMLCAGFLLTEAVAAAGEPGAQPTEGQPLQGQAAAKEFAGSESRDQGMAVLERMAEFLAHAKQFSVNLRIGYDVVQPSGENVEFGERRKLTVRRPDDLRIEVEQSDGSKSLLVFDGKDITAYKEANHVYAVTPKPGNIDTALQYIIRDLGIRMPLALMVVSEFPAVLELRVESAAYVERSVVTAVPTDHVAARSANVDFQVWVAEGAQPLPQRIVITYKTAEGEPQFWADFSDWNLNPDLSKSLFEFTPPQGVQRIPFLVRARQGSGQPTSPGEASATSVGTPQAAGSTGGQPK
jgi:hypothetical protein